MRMKYFSISDTCIDSNGLGYLGRGSANAPGDSPLRPMIFSVCHVPPSERNTTLATSMDLSLYL